MGAKRLPHQRRLVRREKPCLLFRSSPTDGRQAGRATKLQVVDVAEPLEQLRDDLLGPPADRSDSGPRNGRHAGVAPPYAYGAGTPQGAGARRNAMYAENSSRVQSEIGLPILRAYQNRRSASQ